MNIQPIQRRVLPSVLSAKKSLPQGMLKKGAALTAAAATLTAANNQQANLKAGISTSSGDYCGNTEASCVPLMSF